MNERGSSIVGIMGIGLLLSIAVLSLNNWLNRDQSIKELYKNKEIAYYLAEGGIEQVLWQLADDYFWHESSISADMSSPGSSHRSFVTQVVSLEQLNPPPATVADPLGLIAVELDSIGTANTSKERILTKVEISYYFNGQVSFKTVTWQRMPP